MFDVRRTGRCPPCQPRRAGQRCCHPRARTTGCIGAASTTTSPKRWTPPQLRSLMRTPVFGWRTDGSRLIGWSLGRQAMDQILSLAERLDAIAGLLSDR